MLLTSEKKGMTNHRPHAKFFTSEKNGIGFLTFHFVQFTYFRKP